MRCLGISSRRHRLLYISILLFPMGVLRSQDVSTIWIFFSQPYSESDTARLFFANTAAGTYGRDSIGQWYQEIEYPPCFCFNARWRDISTSEPGHGAGFIPLDVRGIPQNPATPDTFQLQAQLIDPGNYRIEWPDSQFLKARCDSIFLVDRTGQLRDTSGDPVRLNMMAVDHVTIASPDSVFASGFQLTIFKYGVHLVDLLSVCFVCPSEPHLDVRQGDRLPSSFLLHQNYPNPFNPSTTIEYDLPRRTVVRLSIYDVLGRMVTTIVNEIQEPGTHRVKFDGSRLSSGVYIYELVAGEYRARKMMVVLK